MGPHPRQHEPKAFPLVLGGQRLPHVLARALMAEVDVRLFETLARQAARPGAQGRASLAVLQEALLETFGPELNDAIELAGEVAGKPYSATRLVVFYPGLVYQRPAQRPAMRALRSRLYPFDVATPAQLEPKPVDGIVVWSSAQGFDTQRAHALWQLAARTRRLEEAARPSVVLRASRVRLNRGGYDSTGRYFGTESPGALLYHVESTAPLPAALEAAQRYSIRWGRIADYTPAMGIWVNAYVRAPSATEASRLILSELGARRPEPRRQRRQA